MSDLTSSDQSEELTGRKSRITQALLDARRELIDLTRKNRLLHTPRTGDRPHCLEIFNADPNDIFITLTRTDKHFSFVPASGEDEVALLDQEGVRLGRTSELQTNLKPEALERRLLKFFREARIFEEEQGISILFFAIGFLNWFEDDRSEECSSAPLILVPVSLERRQGRDAFVLRGRDDDMVVNVSLAEKLHAEFGSVLPELPEGDNWLPSEYLEAVAEATSSRRRWNVDNLGIGLGFFTFSKFMMWRDMDPGTWSHPVPSICRRAGTLLLAAPAPSWSVNGSANCPG